MNIEDDSDSTEELIGRFLAAETLIKRISWADQMTDMMQYDLTNEEFLAHLSKIDTILSDGVPDEVDLSWFLADEPDPEDYDPENLKAVIGDLQGLTRESIDAANSDEEKRWRVIRNYCEGAHEIVTNDINYEKIESCLRNLEYSEYKKTGKFGLDEKFSK